MLEAFRICKNISSIPSGTHATPILVIFGTSCTVLATVPNRIRNFDFFFSECIPWTHTQLWVPQTWSSVYPLDHKKAYKTVPLQILLSVHLTRQYPEWYPKYIRRHFNENSGCFQIIIRIVWTLQPEISSITQTRHVINTAKILGTPSGPLYIISVSPAKNPKIESR